MNDYSTSRRDLIYRGMNGTEYIIDEIFLQVSCQAVNELKPRFQLSII